MKKIEAYESAYPGSMFERESGGYIRRDDADSLAGSLLALIKSGDSAASDFRDALDESKKEADQLRTTLRDILNSEVGRQTLAKIATGQSTETDDGKSWMRAAAEIGRHSGENQE